MKVLIFNCGSSTLKFQVIELNENTPLGRERRLGHGLVDRIGRRGEIKFVAENGERFQETAEIADHGMAARRVFEWLKSLGLMGQDGIEAVGHRVVHGGPDFVEPTLVDDRVIDAIETMRYLAPLHNEPSLKAIHAARAILGATLPMVAVFDTAFHSGMPERSSRYAIPYELAMKHHYTTLWLSWIGAPIHDRALRHDHKKSFGEGEACHPATGEWLLGNSNQWRPFGGYLHGFYSLRGAYDGDKIRRCGPPPHRLFGQPGRGKYQ